MKSPRRFHGPALLEAPSLLGRNNLDPELAIQLQKEYPNLRDTSAGVWVHADLGRWLEQQVEEKKIGP